MWWNMNYDDQHENTRRFLEDQQNLTALLEAPPAIIHEPTTITRRENVFIDKGSRVDAHCKIEGGQCVAIGRYVHIASHAHINIGGGATGIGDYACVASGGKIISGSNQTDALSMSACAPKHMQRVTRTVTKLMPYSAVLTNAVVMPGVTLHEGAVLAAGAVATKDIPAWEVWGGVPARFMRKREVTK